MVVVTKRSGDNKNSLFRRFSKAFFDGNIVDEVRDRLFYKKPSILKKEQKKLQGKNRRSR